MVAVPASEKDDLRRVLDDAGAPIAGARVPRIPEPQLARMFETMLVTRLVDDRMLALARGGGAGGRLSFYLGARGEEAAHLVVAPLRDTDWVFPSPRDQGAWFWRGYPIARYVDQLLGTAGDPAKGRQMPAHHAARWLNLVSISTPVGTQLPQAVGAAYAARAMGQDEVAMALFGEGATSTGEFHVGMNFAAVWKAPCVLVCRTSGAPSPEQTAARTYAMKAIGYGMPGVRVDGGDALAVWQVASDAIDRARAGEGPTLIEVVVDAAQPGRADPVDPIDRLRGYLRHAGIWTEHWEAELTERCERQIQDAIAAAEREPLPAVDSLFDDVYDQLPWHLREQRAGLLAAPRTAPPAWDADADADPDPDLAR